MALDTTYHFFSMCCFCGKHTCSNFSGDSFFKDKTNARGAFALRFSGAIAVNMDIVALLLFIYSKVLSKKEFAKNMEKTKISISTKLTV